MPDINGADDTSLRDALAGAMAGNTPEPVQSAEPVDPSAGTQPGQPRDPHGRFAPRDGQVDQSVSPAPAATSPGAGTGGEATVAGAPARDGDKPVIAPPGFSATTKSIWDKPAWDQNDIQALKKDIAKRETEIERGFAKLRDYKDLDPFVDMARQSGTTLTDAVKRYVEAEQFLEKEPVKGLLWLCQNYGVDPRQLAAAVGGQPQPTGQQPQPNQRIDLSQHLQPIMAPIMQELQQLRGIVYGDKQAQTQQTVQQFFADPAHRYAENVADDMARLIKAGFASDLKDAYDKACWNNPEIRGLLINEQTTRTAAAQAAKAKQASDQAKAAGRSITGGMGSPNPSSANPDNLRAMLEEQFASAARV